MLVRNKNFTYINWGLIVMFFASWFWAIQYKLTPEITYFGEIAFTTMVILVTSIVWLPFCYLLKGILKMSYLRLILTSVVLACLAILYNIYYYEFPTNLDIFYARFHIIFLFLLILCSLVSFIFSKIRLR